ncbi:MAG: alpha/beta hydrolase-fold protein [Cyanobacteria bacterium P01_H01_bin.21]
MATPRVSIPDTEVYPLHSQLINDDFELWCARPQIGFVPSPPGPPYVLYVLDANLFFGTAVEMTRLMHKLYGELPPLLVVGIAYPTEDGFLQGALRNRDFTPSADAGLASMPMPLPQPDQPAKVEPVLGGANTFLRFLKEEVKPLVAAHFDIAPENSTIFGASLGGLFTIYSLFKEPTAFDNYIAVSPSLWWDNEMMFDLELGEVIADGATNIFLAVGAQEEALEIPILPQFKMITNVRRMANQLSQQRRESLDVTLDVIEGETHTSVVPVALTRGLRYVLTTKD